MHNFLALAALALLALPVLARAADEPRSDGDCAQLLERWATDPKAAPRRVIDACKEQLAAGAPALAAAPLAVPTANEAARRASLDPCSGPAAANSVLCWGPWASIAPAAGGQALGPEIARIRDPETRPELAEQFSVDPVPELPAGACEPGTPCGFATVVAGFTSDGAADDTTFARFSVAPDGTRFTVSPVGVPPINSVTDMDTTVDPRDDGYESLRATGTVDNQESALTARVVRDQAGNLVVAADVWTHVSSIQPQLVAQSGYFAWGTSTTQSGLDALNAGNVTLSFSGPMSVDNATTGAMTVNMGASPTWTGTWTNPAWSFGAGGVLTGANLISQAGQFTDNVTGSGNFVQGALVGEQGGPRGVTHIIDVTLEGQGRIKDVGLLRDAAAQTIAP